MLDIFLKIPPPLEKILDPPLARADIERGISSKKVLKFCRSLLRSQITNKTRFCENLLTGNACQKKIFRQALPFKISIHCACIVHCSMHSLLQLNNSRLIVCYRQIRMQQPATTKKIQHTEITNLQTEKEEFFISSCNKTRKLIQSKTLKYNRVLSFLNLLALSFSTCLKLATKASWSA